MSASNEKQTRGPLRGWRALIGHGAYPGIMFGGAALAWLLMSADLPKAISVTGVAGLAGLIVWGMEGLLPYTERWRADRKEFGVNLFHTLISTGAFTLLIEATVLGLFVYAAAALSGWLGAGLWPTHWPLMFQVALGLILGELGAYWAHRLCHLTDIGWRIHVMHHSSEKLHFLASGRNHPLNVLATMALQSALPILMGVTPETLALMSLMTGLNGLLQHANVDMRPGLFNYVFSTSDLHRWHHAKNLDESNTNFGNNLILWDLVFRTYYNPADRAPTTDAGVDGFEVPVNVLSHLATPFLYERYATDASTAVEASSSAPRSTVAAS